MSMLPLCLLAGSLLGSAQEPGSLPTQEPVLMDATMAIINDQVITMSMVEGLAQVWHRSQSGDDFQTLEFFRKAAFGTLVEDALFREGFKLYDLQEDFVDRLVGQEMQDRIHRAGSITALTEELRSLGTDLERETQRLRRAYTRRLIQEVELGIAPAKGRDKYKADIYVKPSEIEAYYNDHISEYSVERVVTARMILLLDRPGEEPGAEQRIRDLAARIEAGELSFADAAGEYSDFGASIRGSLGRVDPEKPGLNPMVLDFLREAQEPGMSEPLQLPRGWALVLAEAIRPAGVVPLQEVQLQIAAKLEEQNFKYLMANTLHDLRKRCYVWGEAVDQVLEERWPMLPEPPAAEDSLESEKP